MIRKSKPVHETGATPERHLGHGPLAVSQKGPSHVVAELSDHRGKGRAVQAQPGLKPPRAHAEHTIHAVHRRLCCRSPEAASLQR